MIPTSDIISACRTDNLRIADFYSDSGYPIQCFNCGGVEIDETVCDFIDVVCGTGPTTEAKYTCRACKTVVAYWAFGEFDPSFVTYAISIRSNTMIKSTAGDL